MATVVNVPADPRPEAYGKGLADLFTAYVTAKKDSQYNQMADQAVKSIYQTGTKEDALKIYDSLPYEVRDKKGAGILQTINDKYPGFESIGAFTTKGEKTTITYKKGENPAAAVAAAGATMTEAASADVFGVDTGDPRTGILTAPTLEEAQAKAAALTERGFTSVSVLTPPEIKTRQESLKSQATVERADVAAAKAHAARQPTEFETKLASRIQQEKSNDPHATSAGITTLVAKEDQIGREITSAYQGANTDKGIVFNSPGGSERASAATNIARIAIRRGLDPTTAQKAAINAADIDVLPSMVEQAGDTGLATTKSTVNARLQREFGATLPELRHIKGLVEQAQSIPEFDGTANTVKAYPVGNTGNKILYTKIEGRFVPLRMAKTGEVKKGK